MDVTETDLPGVGKKHEIDLGEGRELVVVTHNSGRREIHHRTSPDADSERLLTLTDQQARTVGTILEGAYFQPVPSDAVETLLGEDTLLEWYVVDEESPLVGETLASADVDGTTGVTVVAVERAGTVLSDLGAQTTFRAGDTVVVAGDREACAHFDDLLTGATE